MAPELRDSDGAPWADFSGMMLYGSIHRRGALLDYAALWGRAQNVSL
jgi:hypothetical protein